LNAVTGAGAPGAFSGAGTGNLYYLELLLKNMVKVSLNMVQQTTTFYMVLLIMEMVVLLIIFVMLLVLST
jgi:hypothetical protein